MSQTPYAPGEGPTTSVSVSVHEGTISAVRARVGERGVSPYIEAAVPANEEIHGAPAPEEIEAAEREMFGSHRLGA